MTDTLSSTRLQPFLDAETVVLRAPTQAWSSASGTMGDAAVHGIYFGDRRVVSRLAWRIDGVPPEHIATVPLDASAVRFEQLARGLDDAGNDPDVRVAVERVATTTGLQEQLTVTSRLRRPISTTITVELSPDRTAMDVVKAGLAAVVPDDVTLDAGTGRHATWSDEATSVTLSSDRGSLAVEAGGLVVTWQVEIPPHESLTVGFELAAVTPSTVVAGVSAPARWAPIVPAADDDRLARWLDRALDDLEALRLTRSASPDDVFLAAGAPWFFTLFGRDSIWAARFLLPLDRGLTVARGTLRVLAGLQGTGSVAETAEQPGKIMHELRAQTLEIPGEGVTLPPLYYGTVDATALWICLLHDAWTWGLAESDLVTLLPHLEAALCWMRDHGDSDGDGLLEYVDETGHGLSNQGWKDSGDSVQWRDGTLAEGPIALVEVQGYAYEAALRGAELLDHFDRAGGSEWRAWAARLKSRFDDAFWIAHPDGDYPAVALDGKKRPVDTVTSNLGHLFGTGLLSPSQASLIARRLVSPEMSSGFGLRTMSTDAAGYWPLSYHGGSVWTHDTAIAISGLARDGFTAEAAELSAGLLAAAAGFDYRMPELHSGDAADRLPTPVPYPAACRPQAWSAAAAVAVWQALHGVRPPVS